MPKFARQNGLQIFYKGHIDMSKEMAKPFVMGLDIGYSNLKIATGIKGEKPRVRTLPIGAAPVALMPHKLTGEPAESLRVQLNGETWAAGVEPKRLQGWQRELHGDYCASKAWQALFLASLILTERNEIDTLVTGLPVSHYHDKALREQLQARLVGTHQPTVKRTIQVQSVRIVPQPVGAYMHVLNSTQDEGVIRAIERGRCVIIDPGFFSVDWVALEEGEVRFHSSDTSLDAMSVLLQHADQSIHDDYGVAPGVETLEKALRTKETDIFLCGQEVSLADYLGRAADAVAPNALVSLKKSMRKEGVNSNVIILTGGGAKFYRKATEETFPSTRIIVPQDTVSANAQGFWLCA